MNVVITFPTHRCAAPDARRPSGRSAEVIIFPGVRIERREFNLADRLPAVRPQSAGMPPQEADIGQM